MKWQKQFSKLCDRSKVVVGIIRQEEKSKR